MKKLLFIFIATTPITLHFPANAASAPSASSSSQTAIPVAHSHIIAEVIGKMTRCSSKKDNTITFSWENFEKPPKSFSVATYFPNDPNNQYTSVAALGDYEEHQTGADAKKVYESLKAQWDTLKKRVNDTKS